MAPGPGSEQGMVYAVSETVLQRVIANLLCHPDLAAKLLTAIRFSGNSCPPLGGAAVRRCESNVWDSKLGLGTSADRETDLVVRLEVPSEKGVRTVILLIEVKICAPFGQDQPRDYVRRAQLLVARDPGVTAVPVLISPQAYFAGPSAREFPGWLSLEQLRDLFSVLHGPGNAPWQEAVAAARQILPASLHTAAIGYQPLVSLERQEQFAFYKIFVSDYAPGLKLNDSSAGAQSLDCFFATSLGFGTVKHRLEEGLVVAEFLGRGYPPDAVDQVVKAAGLYLRMVGRTGRTTHIFRRERVPPLDMERSFMEQADSVKVCLDEAVYLVDWLTEHRDTFLSWPQG